MLFSFPVMVFKGKNEFIKQEIHLMDSPRLVNFQTFLLSWYASEVNYVAREK